MLKNLVIIGLGAAAVYLLLNPKVIRTKSKSKLFAGMEDVREGLDLLEDVNKDAKKYFNEWFDSGGGGNGGRKPGGSASDPDTYSRDAARINNAPFWGISGA